MWKYFLETYFDYSKKERTGILILCGLIISTTVLPYLFPFFIKPSTLDPKLFEKEIAALERLEDSAMAPDLPGSPHGYPKKDYTHRASREPSALNGELFYFDPNTATHGDWTRLGVQDKTISTISKYLAKGGKFYKPSDLERIWGLHPELVKRLLPFVRISQPERAAFVHSPAKPFVKSAPTLIDINGADTSAWIALPGIGSKLAQRIVLFRDKLGGFYKIEQVAETFGLPDSTFERIRPKLQVGVQPVRQLNINSATLDELKSHPYLRYAIANAITQYRAQHGSFSTIEDLKKIMVISPEVFTKAAPYLRVD